MDYSYSVITNTDLELRVVERVLKAEGYRLADRHHTKLIVTGSIRCVNVWPDRKEFSYAESLSNHKDYVDLEEFINTPLYKLNTKFSRQLDKKYGSLRVEVLRGGSSEPGTVQVTGDGQLGHVLTPDELAEIVEASYMAQLIYND